MDNEKFLNDILNVVNGQRAWDWVAKISQYNRIQASNGYHDSLERIKEEPKKEAPKPEEKPAEKPKEEKESGKEEKKA